MERESPKNVPRGNSFAINEECVFKFKNEVDDGCYKNLKDTNLYVLVYIDTDSLWSRGITATRMPVPEAAMYKDNRLILGKHYIRLTNHLADILPVSETSGKQSLTKFDFNRGILTSYVAHIDVPLLFG